MSAEITLWDVDTGELVREYTADEHKKFEDIAFTSDGTRIIATADRGRSILVLNAKTGGVIHRLRQQHIALAFDVTPDNRLLVIGLGNGSASVIDLDSGQQLRQCEGPTIQGRQDIFSLGISPDGTRVMAGYKEHTVRLWDLNTGLALNDFRTPVPGHEAVVFTPDGLRAVVAEFKGITGLIETETGRLLGTTPLIPGHGSAVAVSPDGASVLICGGVKYENGFKETGDYALRLWRLGEADVQPVTEHAVPTRPTISVDRLTEIPDNPRIVAIDMQGSPWLRDEDAALFANLPELQGLVLDGATVTADFFEKIGTLPNLERISARDLVLSTVPESLGTKLPNLAEIDLSGSRVETLAAEAVESMKSLQSIDLSSATIPDQQVASLASSASLKQVDLADSRIGTEAMRALAKLESLRSIVLSGNNIDEIETLLAESFNNLSEVELFNTNLDGQAFDRLAKARPGLRVISGRGRLNVLSLIEVNGDAIAAGWGLGNAGLSVHREPGSATAKQTAVELPLFLPPEFELKCDVIRTVNIPSPLFQLPLPDGTRVMVGFDHWPDEGGYTIIHGVDGAMEKQSPSKTPGVTVPVGADTSTRLRIRVEGTGDNIRVSTFAGEQPIVSWEGERKRLRPRFYVEAEHPLIPTIVASTKEVSFAISKLELTPLSGETKLTRYRQRESEEGLDRKVADWILQPGGRVTVRPLEGSGSRRKIYSIQDLPNEPFRVLTADSAPVVNIDGDRIRQYSKLEELVQISLPDGNFENSDLVTLLDAPRLARVYLNGSALDDRGMTILSRLKNLIHLTVSRTNVTNEGLAHLSGNEKLVLLICGSTKMDGKLMEIAGSLPNLQRLEVDHVGLTGEELKHLTQLNRLTSFGLRNTSQLVAKDMEFIASRSSLTVLVLSGGSLGADAITRLSPLTRLKTLDLTDNQIGDEGMARLLAFRTLSELRVESNRVTDAGVEAIANLVSLRTLSLAENPGITDTSVDYLGKLRLLGELDVTNTSMSDQGIDRLKTLLPRCSILTADGLAPEGEDQ